MAFSGTAVVNSHGKDVVRITGASLAASAAGTITENGGGGDVTLPAAFPSFGADNIRCFAVHAASPAGGTPLVSVAKSGGPPITTLTLTNEDGANNTGELEIWVENMFSRKA